MSPCPTSTPSCARRSGSRSATRSAGRHHHALYLPRYLPRSGGSAGDLPPHRRDERRAGQFAFNDPSKGGSGLVNILGNEERYNAVVVADWGKVWDWFNASEDKFTITSSNNDSIDRVNQGEVMMAAAWDDDTAVSLAKGTLFKRAKLYIPALGMPGGGDSLGIPANAPHKAAAMLFVAYLIEADVQKQLNATIGSYLARTDISGENALIPEEQRQQNGRPWIPGTYKAHFIQQFVSEVLQK